METECFAYPAGGQAVHSPISLSPFPVWVRTPGVEVLTNTQGIPKVGGPRMLTHSCCIQINCKCTQASQGLIPRCSSEPQRHCKRQQVPFGSGCWRPEWPARTSQVPTACSHTLPEWSQLLVASLPSVLGLHNVDFLNEAGLPLEMRAILLGRLDFSGIGCCA